MRKIGHRVEFKGVTVRSGSNGKFAVKFAKYGAWPVTHATWPSIITQ